MSEPIPFGVEVVTGRIVEPADVPRGLACGCVCGHCGAPLVARKGEKRVPHFAHSKDAGAAGDTGGCGETAVHLMAKQLICERMEIGLTPHLVRSQKYGHLAVWSKGGLYSLATCEPEKTIEDRRPDIVATLEDGRELCIEIAVTHFCDAEKCAWFRDTGRLAVEITLPQLCSTQELEALLFAPGAAADSRKWLHHPPGPNDLVALAEKEAAWEARLAIRAEAAATGEAIRAQNAGKAKPASARARQLPEPRNWRVGNAGVSDADIAAARANWARCHQVYAALARDDSRTPLFVEK